jgi:DNA replication licensing factor MCM4
MLDTISEANDRRLASHIISLYEEAEDEGEAMEVEGEQGRMTGDMLTKEQLAGYISYARQFCNPTIHESSMSKLVEGYLDMRKSGHKKTVSATPRQLESLIRLSESLARM